MQLLGGAVFTIPIWVLFQSRFLSQSEISFLQGIILSISIFLDIPTGLFADLIGRRKSLMIGFSLSALGLFVTSFSNSASIMITGLLITGIGSAFLSGADIANLYDTLKDIKQEKSFPKYLANGFLLYRIILIFSMFTGGFIYELNLILPYLLRGIASILSIIVAYLIIEPDYKKKNYLNRNILQEIKIAIGEIKADNKKLNYILFLLPIAGIIWACMFSMNQMLTTYLNYSARENSYLFATCYLLSTISLWIMTHLKKQPKRNLVILIVQILFIIAFIPTFLLTKETIFVTILFTVIISGIRSSYLQSYLNEDLRSEVRASFLSAVNMILNIIAVLIIWSSGLFTRYISYPTFYSIIGFVIIILTIKPFLFLLIQSKKYNNQ